MIAWPDAFPRNVDEGNRLVWKVLNDRFAYPVREVEDAFQDGWVGLLRALEAWDPLRSAWSTCAYVYIRTSICAGRHTRARQRRLDGLSLSSWERTHKRPMLDSPDWFCWSCRRDVDRSRYHERGLCRACYRRRYRIKARYGGGGVCPTHAKVLYCRSGRYTKGTYCKECAE